MQKKTSVLASLLSISFLSSCITPNTNEPKPSIAPSQKPSPEVVKPKDGILINFVDGIITIGGIVKDSKTNKILDKEVKISFDGKDKDKLENLLINSKNGQFSFSLKKGTKASKENPIVIKAIINAEGYFSNSQDLEITNNSVNQFIINLVNVKDAPTGVNTNEKQILINNGKLSENISINLSNQSNKTVANLNIKEGTIMKDINGNTLNGNMKMEVGFFDSQDPNSLKLFPGGFRLTTTIADGSDNSGIFTTGGFLSARITDSNGKEVSTFSNPIDIDMTMPKGIMNPETKKPLKVGDTISVWSYNENTGKWKYENTAKVSGTDTNGNFNLKFTASHLSYWNLDWFDDTTCNPKLNFKWKNEKKYYPVMADVSFDGMGEQPWIHGGYLENDENTLYNFPTNRAIKFDFKVNGISIGSKIVTLEQQDTNNRFWWENRDCKDDINVDMDLNNFNMPKIIKSPYNLYFKIKNLFNKEDFKEFLEKFAWLPSTELEAISKTLYPNDIEKSIMEDDYNKLKNSNINSNTIERIKNTLSNKYYPVIPVWYRNISRNSDWKLFYSNFGYNIDFFVNDTYEFKLIYDGEEYKKEYTITENSDKLLDEIELPFVTAKETMSNKLSAF